MSIERAFELDDYPVYVREGAILPMNVSRSYSGFGDRNSDGFLTWAIYPEGRTSFQVEHPDKSGATRMVVETGTELRVAVDGVHKPHILRIRQSAKPTRVELDGEPLSEGERWNFDASAWRLTIRTREYRQGSYVIR